jgi:prohibitin 1
MQNLGVDWDERVLPSIGSEVVKAVVAQYNAESLLTKREEVSKAVSHSLRERAKDFNIILDDVSITHLSFSQEFTKAVESKQVAEQDAQRAQFVVMKAEQVGFICTLYPHCVPSQGQQTGMRCVSAPKLACLHEMQAMDSQLASHASMCQKPSHV